LRSVVGQDALEVIAEQCGGRLAAPHSFHEPEGVAHSGGRQVDVQRRIVKLRDAAAAQQRGCDCVVERRSEHESEIVRLDLYQSQVIRDSIRAPVGWSLDEEDEMIKGTLAAVGAEPYPDPRERKTYPLRRTGG
jgi:hypothetical protein